MNFDCRIIPDGNPIIGIAFSPKKPSLQFSKIHKRLSQTKKWKVQESHILRILSYRQIKLRKPNPPNINISHENLKVTFS